MYGRQKIIRPALCRRETGVANSYLTARRGKAYGLTVWLNKTLRTSAGLWRRLRWPGVRRTHPGCCEKRLLKAHLGVYLYVVPVLSGSLRKQDSCHRRLLLRIFPKACSFPAKASFSTHCGPPKALFIASDPMATPHPRCNFTGE